MGKGALSKDRRLTIGLFVSELEGEYSSAICSGVEDTAKENDANLFIFPGKTMRAPYQYQYQYNIIYDFVHKNSLDALILASGTLCNFLSEKEFHDFYSHFSPIPMVSISIKLKDIPSVLIDNKLGFKQAISHLITKHQKKKIAFIRGPESNIEAEERYQTFLEALQENGLPLDPALVVNGDFTVYSGIKAVEILLEKRKVHFDAIVAANDEMAISALNELAARNYKIPKDIAVIGFDNVEGAKFSNPPLTTVRQPIYKQAQKACETALKMIAGKKVPKVTMLETELIRRSSCGCFVPSLNSSLPEESNEIAQKNSKDGLAQTNTKIHEILKEFEGFAPRREKIGRWIREIFEAFHHEEDIQRKSKEFLEKFKKILGEDSLKSDDVVDLQNIFSLIREHFLHLFKNFPNSDRKVFLIEIFLQKARIIVEELFQQENSKRLAHFYQDIRTLRQTLSSLVSNVYLKVENLSYIINELLNIGIKSSYIFLYPREIIHNTTEKWKKPKHLEPIMIYNENGAARVSPRRNAILTEELLSNPYLPKNRRWTLTLNPLFFMEEQFGIILCELDLRNSYNYETLSLQISCVLKISSLIRAREKAEHKLKDALKELEVYNQKLNNLSQTDELTGLYNRRGFITLAKQNLILSKRTNKNGILFYADLDGLKRINDNYGHDEGDFAIQSAANILKNTFRNMDILARMGGDEFTVLAIDTNPEFIDIFKTRFDKNIQNYNQIIEKPYKISVSIGWISFSSREIESLEKLLAEADNCLYEQKKHREARKSEKS
jgi:diguanylate cyclase (GGDEF)-like protein